MFRLTLIFYNPSPPATQAGMDWIKNILAPYTRLWIKPCTGNVVKYHEGHDEHEGKENILSQLRALRVLVVKKFLSEDITSYLKKNLSTPDGVAKR